MPVADVDPLRNWFRFPLKQLDIIEREGRLGVDWGTRYERDVVEREKRTFLTYFFHRPYFLSSSLSIFLCSFFFIFW